MDVKVRGDGRDVAQGFDVVRPAGLRGSPRRGAGLVAHLALVGVEPDLEHVGLQVLLVGIVGELGRPGEDEQVVRPVAAGDQPVGAGGVDWLLGGGRLVEHVDGDGAEGGRLLEALGGRTGRDGDLLVLDLHLAGADGAAFLDRDHLRVALERGRQLAGVVEEVVAMRFQLLGVGGQRHLRPGGVSGLDVQALIQPRAGRRGAPSAGFSLWRMRISRCWQTS